MLGFICLVECLGDFVVPLVGLICRLESSDLQDVGGRTITVLNHGQRIFAIDSSCYHFGGPLGEEGDIEELGDTTCIVCPWHHRRVTSFSPWLHLHVLTFMQNFQDVWGCSGGKQRSSVLLYAAYQPAVPCFGSDLSVL
jgi:hypothetical protein